MGDEFTDVVGDLIDRIAVMPEVYVVVLNEVRRAKLRWFPYLVYYRVLSDRVEVIGVLHGSRDPGVWQGRA